MLQLCKEFVYSPKSVAYKKVPGKGYRAHIRCIRLQMALRIFFISTGILGLQRFDGRANQSALKNPKRIVPRQVRMMDTF